MKRLAVFAILAGLSTYAAACGGGAPESSQPAAAPPAQAEPAAAAAPPAAAAATPSVPPPPTTDEAYQTTEKMISDSFRNLRDNVASKNAAGVGQEARRLEQLFMGVESFWAGRKVNDAVGFAKAATGAAQTIAAAAEANDMAKAEAGVSTLDTQCQACHKAHRAQDGDYFSIK